ncbi:MAG: helix-turn-helix domain-containing protein [Pseudonocardiaceae bacterium]
MRAEHEPLDRLIGERLRLARTAQRQKRTVVAGLAGITTDYLYQIECGLKLPSVPVLLQLARVLDVPVAALLADEPTRPPLQVRTLVRKSIGL